MRDQLQVPGRRVQVRQPRRARLDERFVVFIHGAAGPTGRHRQRHGEQRDKLREVLPRAVIARVMTTFAAVVVAAAAAARRRPPVGHVRVVQRRGSTVRVRIRLASRGWGIRRRGGVVLGGLPGRRVFVGAGRHQRGLIERLSMPVGWELAILRAVRRRLLRHLELHRFPDHPVHVALGCGGCLRGCSRFALRRLPRGILLRVRRIFVVVPSAPAGGSNGRGRRARRVGVVIGDPRAPS
mmetsp:Transcript_12121/g.50989  ORF Transcript_12121/g.50989 Transcript_12121/m.50989 type:complete len:239 (-) Transcript_12121:284-1000(-)